ncbi:hypothetical protein QF002_001251 [Paraburkholderia youngii]
MGRFSLAQTWSDAFCNEVPGAKGAGCHHSSVDHESSLSASLSVFATHKSPFFSTAWEQRSFHERQLQ